MASPESREVLQQSLEQHRHELQLAVRDLRLAATPSALPGDIVRRHPLTALTAAFVVGAWMGWRERESI